MDVMSMAQLQHNFNVAKGLLGGVVAAAAASGGSGGVALDPRSLAMASMATLESLRYLPNLVDHHMHHLPALHHLNQQQLQQQQQQQQQQQTQIRQAVVPMMETWVLIPPELWLVLTPSADGAAPAAAGAPSARVWTRVAVSQGRRWSPFQGTVRLGVMPSAEAPAPNAENDVRCSNGSYDEVTEVHGLKVRHCNWVRFLRSSPLFTAEVNVVCSKVKGEPVYEAVRPMAANTELVVFYLPGHNDEEELFLPAVRSLRTSLFRRTMGLILEDSPLDLSLSLVSRVLGPTGGAGGASGGASGSDGRQSVSSESIASSGEATGGEENDSGAVSLVVGADRRANGVALGHVTPGPKMADLRTRNVGNVANSAPPASVHGRPARQRPLLPCQVCGKAFDRPSLLNRHMRTHTGEKPHVCDVCGKGFSTSSSLNTHRRIHSGEKPHQCPVCGKRFTASSNLYYHRMTHIKEKPHKCALCSKSFPTPGDLKSHMYVHSGSWPFKCHVCSRGFSKHTNLKNHLFLHTGDKPHACELCNKRFALACNLRAHMKTHEGEPQEECARCGKTFLISGQAHDMVSGLCTECSRAEGSSSTSNLSPIDHLHLPKEERSSSGSSEGEGGPDGGASSCEEDINEDVDVDNEEDQ